MRMPGWLFLLLIVFVVGLTALLSVTAFVVAREVAIGSANLLKEPIRFDTLVNAQPTATLVAQLAPTLAPTTAPTSAPGETPQPTPLPQPTATFDPAADLVWRDPSRVNILLLGIDQRSAVEDKGPFRSDTIIIVSVDPVRKTAGVLSVPRDLWVKIPGFTQGRINTAHSLGDSSAYPGGGPALAAETVRQNLGIPVDKYVRINFDVFTKMVNTVAPDGVEICVKEVIDDPNFPDAGYGFIHVHFDPGCQVLNSEKLLQYARTRHTEKSDFDRARRQQEVMQALREKVLSVGGVTNFIGQAPTIWNDLSANVETNFTLDELLRLAKLMQDIPREKIKFGVIDNLYVDLAATSTGDKVLVPRYNAIRLLIQQVFNPQADVPLADLRSKAEAEAAKIAVFNNTETAGLALKTRDWLTGRSVVVNQVGNAQPPTKANTLIKVNGNKIWTARYLAALLGLAEDRIEPGVASPDAPDITILVGPDISPLLSKP